MMNSSLFENEYNEASCMCVWGRVYMAIYEAEQLTTILGLQK